MNLIEINSTVSVFLYAEDKRMDTLKLIGAMFQLCIGDAPEAANGYNYPISIKHSLMFLGSTMFPKDDYKSFIFQTK
jgi:hypothetical protein